MSEQDINQLTNQQLQMLLDKARDRQRELQKEMIFISSRIQGINEEFARRMDSK